MRNEGEEAVYRNLGRRVAARPREPLALTGPRRITRTIAGVRGVRCPRRRRAWRRFDEAVGIFSGRKRVYTQEPLLLHYPRLPAIPFYEREHFPWLGKLEAATATIQGELAGALEAARDEFSPYIAFAKDAPVN